jgi:two-component system nitrate/nitrite response regulator NarL
LSPPKQLLDTDGVLKRILIADDNGYVRTVIRTVLQDQDEIQVCGEAADGAEAIEKTRQLKPDLLLLDLSMPSLNGAEVALILKNTMPDVRVIMFTMYSDKVGSTLISALGVDAVLSKPDGMSHLVDSINGVFASH